MANVEKLSITLSKDMADAVRAAVESGDYATTSEVIRDALRGSRFKRISVDPSDTATIRRLVEEGINSANRGKLKPAEEVFDRLEAKYRAMTERTKGKAKAKARR